MESLNKSPYNAIAFLGLLIHFYLFANAQDNEIAIIRVDSGPYDRANTLVGVSLEGLSLDLANRSLALYSLTGGEQYVDAQLDLQGEPRLWWKLPDQMAAGETREYSLRLEASKPAKSTSGVLVADDRGDLLVSIDGRPVLRYNFRYAPLPEGVPEIYNRAGYIHPVWSPKGEVLSRIQPPDHYHHVGLWNPWTHTAFKGKIIDFWNLLKGEGTVKPVSVISTTSNGLFGGFRVLHDHIDLNGLTPGGFEVALKEVWDVRVWHMDTSSWLIDLTSTMNCATDSIFRIIKYRYQGFGFRATEKWDDTTARLLTSEGKDKSDGNSTRARWCDVNGVSKFGTSGVLFITHPSNYNYPEPIRIWPVGSNQGRENVFFNFNPAMDRDWILEPGQDYRLRYRMFVYDGQIDRREAERLWADFAHPPRATLEIVQHE
ncbi:MAG: PmoA family protein [Cytophagales bacterium]|nr:PmoA family protein [Cytophagales bacterium]